MASGFNGNGRNACKAERDLIRYAAARRLGAHPSYQLGLDSDSAAQCRQYQRDRDRLPRRRQLLGVCTEYLKSDGTHAGRRSSMPDGCGSLASDDSHTDDRSAESAGRRGWLRPERESASSIQRIDDLPGAQATGGGRLRGARKNFRSPHSCIDAFCNLAELSARVRLFSASALVHPRVSRKPDQASARSGKCCLSALRTGKTEECR